MVRVGLACGDKDYQAVRGALELIRGDVQIPSDRPVLIKPNLVSPTVELATTPVEAVRATMDFLVDLGVKRFIVGEGTADEEGDTLGAFERFGYYSLEERYDVELRNLHEDDFIVFEALDEKLTPVDIRLARTCFDSYVVSVARMKTHSEVIATLAIKNVAIGSIYNADRHDPDKGEPGPGAFSHAPRPLNLSIARLNQAVSPGLAVVDGVVGMEGNGPVNGTPISSGVAIAGTNALAVDLVGCELMGFDYRTIGYLWYLSQIRDLSRKEIEVVGEDPAKRIASYKSCENLPAQLPWWVENWREYLSGGYVKSGSGTPVRTADPFDRLR